MRGRWRRLVTAIASLFAASTATAQASQPTGIEVRHLSLVDAKRSVKASMGFAGSPTRRIDVTVWYPTKAAGADFVADGPLTAAAPRPLVIYSHGTYDRADDALYLVRDLVNHGYIVAAPDYPLTSRAAYTHVKGPDLSDVVNQIHDLAFIIDRLLADKQLAPAIDKDRIGTFGHSLGAVTSYFASFGMQTRDPRIKATVLMGAGNPVQAALTNDMGLAGTAFANIPTPILFMSAEHDLFAGLVGRPYAAYGQVPGPKYEAMVKGGAHVFFRDGDEQVIDGRNPDCLFFDRSMPSMKIPGCSDRLSFTTREHQHAITSYAMLAFFDAYLKGDAAARARLQGLGTAMEGVTLRHDE